MHVRILMDVLEIFLIMWQGLTYGKPYTTIKIGETQSRGIEYFRLLRKNSDVHWFQIKSVLCYAVSLFFRYHMLSLLADR